MGDGSGGLNASGQAGCEGLALLQIPGIDSVVLAFGGAG